MVSLPHCWHVRNTFVNVIPDESDEPESSFITSKDRSRSWPCASACMPDTPMDTAFFRPADGGTTSGVLFDMYRFPIPSEATADLLDYILEDEPGLPLRIVGDSGALKRLFSLPFKRSGEAVCLHRVGDCIVVTDVEADDPSMVGVSGGSTSTYQSSSALPTVERRIVRERSLSPGHSQRSLRCQVVVEDGEVRIFPRVDAAEPVEVGMPIGIDTPISTSCEWHVREGVSLLAISPKPPPTVGHEAEEGVSCDWLRFMEGCAAGRVQILQDGSVSIASMLGSKTGSDLHEAVDTALHQYYREVTHERVVILTVNIDHPLEHASLTDAWLSCCLHGSPSLLCFFFNERGICLGCRCVAASAIPSIAILTRSFRAQALTFNSDEGNVARGRCNHEFNDFRTFDPDSIRKMSHALLESLLLRCSVDGTQCVVFASPLGVQLLETTTTLGNDDEVDTAVKPSSDDENDSLMLAPMPKPRLEGRPEVLPGFEVSNDVNTEPCNLAEFSAASSSCRRRAHITRALLLYHAAVRLASPRFLADTSRISVTAVKEVPVGSRWTAKGCREPLRVRKIMLAAIRAIRASMVLPSSPTARCPPRRYLLLHASACEFVADTFLAEDASADPDADACRYCAALNHLNRSSALLAEHQARGPEVHVENDASRLRKVDEDFGLSVKRLSDRISAKRTNAHLCLATLRQRQLWQPASGGRLYPGFGCIGAAMRELDVAEAGIKSSKAGSPSASGAIMGCSPAESSVLASISKWKADIFYKLAKFAKVGSESATRDGSKGLAPADVDPITVEEFLTAQTTEFGETLLKPLNLQCERWLQSTVSLSLRGLRELADVPTELSAELSDQARALLACAYQDLGSLYANTGRFTKAMTHAKQGIELFAATRNKVAATTLQLWLCRLQLRLALPHIAEVRHAVGTDGVMFECTALLSRLPATTSVEEAACEQASLTLRRALQALDGTDVAERNSQSEVQVLLGCLLLRKGLCMTRRLQGPHRSICRILEDGLTLACTLELVQATLYPDDVDESGLHEAIDSMQHASSHFKEAGAAHLGGLAHASLAAVYVCGRQDTRTLRLALTHCRHASQYLEGYKHSARETAHTPVAAGHTRLDAAHRLATQIAVRLLEAKALRRLAASRGSTRTSDIDAALAFCEVALKCDESEEACPEAGQTEVISCADETGRLERSQDLQMETPPPSPSMSCMNGGKAPPPRALLSDEQRSPLLSYVRQELGQLLLRLLRCKGGSATGRPAPTGDRAEDATASAALGPQSGDQELKALYYALLTAWHSESGQVEALLSMREYLVALSQVGGS